MEHRGIPWNFEKLHRNLMEIYVTCFCIQSSLEFNKPQSISRFPCDFESEEHSTEFYDTLFYVAKVPRSSI